MSRATACRLWPQAASPVPFSHFFRELGIMCSPSSCDSGHSNFFQTSASLLGNHWDSNSHLTGWYQMTKTTSVTGVIFLNFEWAFSLFLFFLSSCLAFRRVELFLHCLICLQPGIIQDSYLENGFSKSSPFFLISALLYLLLVLKYHREKDEDYQGQLG